MIIIIFEYSLLDDLNHGMNIILNVLHFTDIGYFRPDITIDQLPLT